MTLITSLALYCKYGEVPWVEGRNKNLGWRFILGVPGELTKPASGGEEWVR